MHQLLSYATELSIVIQPSFFIHYQQFYASLSSLKNPFVSFSLLNMND